MESINLLLSQALSPYQVTLTSAGMRDDCLVDGRFDVTRYQPAARLGYHDYAFVRDVVELRRPNEPR